MKNQAQRMAVSQQVELHLMHCKDFTTPDNTCKQHPLDACLQPLYQMQLGNCVSRMVATVILLLSVQPPFIGGSSVHLSCSARFMLAR
jgi:hypothetical protein